MISFWRELASRWYVGVLLSAGVIMYSCQTPSAVNVNKSYTGEELFNGIIFGKGAVAASIPEIANQTKIDDVVSKEDLAKVQEIQTALMNKLKERNPNFFLDFKNSMESGQHLVIKKALKNASEMVFQAILDLTNANNAITKEELISQVKATVNIDEIKASKGKIDQVALRQQLSKINFLQNDSRADATTSLQTDASACIAVAVVAVLALAVAAAAAVIVFIFWVGAAESTGKTQLQEEMVVNSIAISLAI